MKCMPVYVCIYILQLTVSYSQNVWLAEMSLKIPAFLCFIIPGYSFGFFTVDDQYIYYITASLVCAIHLVLAWSVTSDRCLELYRLVHL